MKRILAFVLLLTVLSLTLSGCFNVKSGEYDEVIGTYEMTQYSLTGSEADGIASHDYLEADHAVCYLVISNSSRGYYYYKDDQTPAVCKEVEIRLVASDDEGEEGLYSYVEFRASSEEEFLRYGIHVSDSLFGDHKLNRTDKTHAGNIFDGNYHVTSTLTRKFTRVSRKTDLKTVERKVGDVTVIPFV